MNSVRAFTRLAKNILAILGFVYLMQLLNITLPTLDEIGYAINSLLMGLSR